MDKIIFESLNDYFTTLTKLGHVTDDDTYGLLIFSFLTDLIDGYKDYVSKEDYYLFSQATLILYGKDCLVPYDDYIENTNTPVNMSSVEINDLAYKLYKLTEKLSDNIDKVQSTLDGHIDVITENTYKINNLESSISGIDIRIANNNNRINKLTATTSDRLNTLEENNKIIDESVNILNNKTESLELVIVDTTNKVDTIETKTDNLKLVVDDNTGRIEAIENTKVIQNKEDVDTIPDIVL